MTRNDVVRLVEQYLTPESLDGDISFQVDERGIFERDGWLHVPVRPSRSPRRSYHFYNLLGDVNADIMEKEGVQVILMAEEPVSEGEPLVPA